MIARALHLPWSLMAIVKEIPPRRHETFMEPIKTRVKRFFRQRDDGINPADYSDDYNSDFAD